MKAEPLLHEYLHGQNKVTAQHLQRRAYIYIRQSTLGQVLNHRASQFNQMQMLERARQLGWQRDQVYVIQSDQGTTASGAARRAGFQELVAEVSLGRVGIIFGYEVSRLARNNSDWYRLLDLAAAFDTLIADYDGIYNPQLFNDRLLLGLKGTMSEAELHLFRLRMQAGRMRLVERGEYRLTLPTGLVRLSDHSVVKDPDEQVQSVLNLVFEKFDELGSTYQVTRYFQQQGIQLPRRQVSGAYKGQILWKPATQAIIYSLLKNPAYAGTFAFGRRQLEPSRRHADQPRSGISLKPMEEWLHVQPDVYPSYISWEQYQRNQAQLQQNMTRFNDLIYPQGVARQGAALLQGLVICGHCGQRLWVAYKPTARYICNRLARQTGNTSWCHSFHGPSVEAVVVQAFFEALQPAQLDALDAVLEQQDRERQRQVSYWQQQAQRAEYEAQRAQRQYDSVEPENRLVAAELERRWEAKLLQLQDIRQAYDDVQRATSPTLSAELRDQFRQICDTLPRLWQTELTAQHKKQLLRSLISRIILTRQQPDQIAIRIVWISGHFSLLSVQPPVFRTQDLSHYEQMLERIKTLFQDGVSDADIAQQLTQEGFRSARQAFVSAKVVQQLRLQQGWQRTRPQNQLRLKMDGFFTVQGLARRLGVNREWIRHRIRTQQLDPKYVQRHPERDMMLIQDCPEVIAFLQQQLSSQARSE